MYILKILRAVKKMKIKELKDLIFTKCYRQIGFPKENSYYSIKRKKKNT